MAGFKIADGFVEIHGEINKNQIRQASTRAGSDAGSHFTKAFGEVDLFGQGEGFTRMTSRHRVRGWGKRVAAGFMSGFGEGMFTPSPEMVRAMRTGIPAILGSPAGIAGIVVGGAFAASFISAILTSGISAVVGGLFVGLGALALRENEIVAGAWERTARRVDTAFADSASGLVPAFAQAAEDAGDGFVTRLRPRLESIFDDLRPGVAPLLEGVLGTVESLLAGIQPHMAGLVQGFLVPFSQQLPRIGEAAGNFFGQIMRNGPAVAEAFEDIVDITVFLADVMDDALILGTRLFSLFRNSLPPITAMLIDSSNSAGGMANALTSMVPPLGQALLGVGAFERGTKDAAGSGAVFSRMGHNIAGALLTARTQTDGAARSTVELSEDMFDAALAAGTLYDALQLLNGGTLAVRQAERDFQAAIDDATQAAKDNGQTLDENTEKGRGNQQALDHIATTAMRVASAIYEQSGSQEDATAAMLTGRKELIRVAIQMGLNREKAEDLADSIIGIPSEWKTQFSSNANSARAGVNKYREAIEAVPSFKRTTLLRQLITQDFGVNAPTPNRFGGIHHAQHGLLSTSRMFGRSNRTLFAFNEPETGGEAFIARNAPREQSLAIGAEAMRWHRAVVVPMERAATTMAAGAGTGPTRSERPVNNVNVRVFVGDRELTDLVRVEIEDHETTRSTRDFMGAGLAR